MCVYNKSVYEDMCAHYKSMCTYAHYMCIFIFIRAYTHVYKLYTYHLLYICENYNMCVHSEAYMCGSTHVYTYTRVNVRECMLAPYVYMSMLYVTPILLLYIYTCVRTSIRVWLYIAHV